MNTSPLLDLQRELGAETGPRPECPALPTAVHFGDPEGEYRSGQRACALLDASDRDRITLRGPDAADFLHRILANDVRALAVGASQRNLLLSPKGRVRYDMRLERDEDEIRITTEARSGDALRNAVEAYHFSEAVRFETTGEDHAPLDLVGVGGDELLERVLGESLDLAPDRHRVVNGGVRVERLAHAPLPTLRLDAGKSGVASLWQELVRAGATPAGTLARESWRVERRAALQGMDFDAESNPVYPQEARLEEGFSLAKGCYVGQEVAAKLDTYGGLNRLLVLLRLEGGPGTAGESLFPGGDPERPVGRITSSAFPPGAEHPLALALVKVAHADSGTRLSRAAGTGAATVIDPVGTASTAD